MSKSTACSPPSEFFFKLSKEFSDQFPVVGEANVLLLLRGGCDILLPKKMDASAWPTAEEEDLLQGKCAEWLELATAMQKEYPSDKIFMRDILLLMLREARRIKEKKVEDKNGHQLKAQCLKVLTFRLNDPEKEKKAALRRNENAVWKEVQKECREPVKKLLKVKGCNDEITREEIWLDANFGLLRNLADPDYWLDTSVKSYLTTLALYSWYKRIRGGNKMAELLSSKDGDAGEEDQIFDEVLMEDFRREEDRAAYRLDIKLVLKALESLTPDLYRNILKAWIFEQLTDKEIAEKFSISNENTRTTKSRALKKLKNQLGDNFL